MKALDVCQMESVNGGSWECAMSVVSCGASIIGAGLSLVSLQGWGVALGVVGIYTGCPLALIECGGGGE